MWNDYYDEIEYIEKTDKLDKSGSIVYKPPVLMKARCVSGGEKFVIGKEEVKTLYTRKYHLPIMIKEGDKLGGRLVVNVEPSRDVFGDFCFCIAKVE